MTLGSDTARRPSHESRSVAATVSASAADSRRELTTNSADCRPAQPWQHTNNNHAHTHTPPFNGPLSGTTWVSWHQKGKTNLDFTEARDSEWQWHHLGHMQVCTSLQTDNHASNPPLSFLQAGSHSCHPTNSVKALKGYNQAMWQI